MVAWSGQLRRLGGRRCGRLVLVRGIGRRCVLLGVELCGSGCVRFSVE